MKSILRARSEVPGCKALPKSQPLHLGELDWDSTGFHPSYAQNQQDVLHPGIQQAKKVLIVTLEQSKSRSSRI